MSVANHDSQPSERLSPSSAVSEPAIDIQQSGPSSRVKGLVRLAFALGGGVREAIYVTLDALRGGYDH